jgi:hypothetical protein
MVLEERVTGAVRQGGRKDGVEPGREGAFQFRRLQTKVKRTCGIVAFPSRGV